MKDVTAIFRLKASNLKIKRHHFYHIERHILFLLYTLPDVNSDWRDKQNKYSSSRVVRQFFFEPNKYQ